jgi:uncharacterized protein (DUF1697 family)
VLPAGGVTIRVPVRQSHVEQPFVALLRGINVGGKNLLPMRALIDMFIDAGCSDVRTYIASGNVVFAAPQRLAEELPERIGRAIAHHFGFSCVAMVRSAQSVARVVAANPYVAATHDVKQLHVVFLARKPARDAVTTLDPKRSPGDEFTVSGDAIYLRLPAGTATSKLTNAYFDSRLATTSTVRNWNTVLKLADMLAERQRPDR